MKVRYTGPETPELTPGAVYDAIAEDKHTYALVLDTGRVEYFLKRNFETTGERTDPEVYAAHEEDLGARDSTCCCVLKRC